MKMFHFLSYTDFLGSENEKNSNDVLVLFASALVLFVFKESYCRPKFLQV